MGSLWFQNLQRPKYCLHTREADAKLVSSVTHSFGCRAEQRPEGKDEQTRDHKGIRTFIPRKPLRKLEGSTHTCVSARAHTHTHTPTPTLGSPCRPMAY